MDVSLDFLALESALCRLLLILELLLPLASRI